MFVPIFNCVCIYPNRKAGLNSDFSFSSVGCLTKAKEPCLPNYLLTFERRTDGFVPFPKALLQSETLSVSSGFELKLPILF